MRECNEKCMANVNGHCAVKKCHGAFIGFSLRLETTEKAANLYEMVHQMFMEDFPEGDTYHAKETKLPPDA